MDSRRLAAKWHNMNGRKKRGFVYFLLALPFVVLIFAFSYFPLFGWYYAFTDYKLGRLLNQTNFIGLENILKLFKDRELMRVLRNTLVMSSLNIASSVLPVAFAIMLNEIRTPLGKRVLQTVTTLPNFISWIVVYGVAFTIFSSQGLLNEVLSAIGLPKSQMGLIGEREHVWIFQLGLGIWKNLGWGAIIYLASISSIDMELYDAAKTDGANKLQCTLHVTLPGLLPTYFVMLLLSISNLLNNGFEQYYVFWNSLVADKIEVLDYYVYKLSFTAAQYSYTIAIGMVKSLLSILLLAIVNVISKKIRGYSII